MSALTMLHDAMFPGSSGRSRVARRSRIGHGLLPCVFKPFSARRRLKGNHDQRRTPVMSVTLSDPVLDEAAAMAGSDEAALVRAAVDGDSTAFEKLYRRHVGRIHGLCWRLFGGDDLKAELATQDVFVRAWERLGSFRGEAQFGTWLHRVAVNVALGEQRVLRRWVTFEDPDDAPRPELVEVGSAQRVTDRMDLERALAKLPPGARTVLLLHDVEGYRHEDISNLTGIAVGTSKAQLHRARRLMKEWLQ